MKLAQTAFFAQVGFKHTTQLLIRLLVDVIPTEHIETTYIVGSYQGNTGAII